MSMVALIVTALMLLPVSQTDPQATIAQGQARGRLEGDVAVFRGLPYTQPPVGDRRLRPPGPAPTPAWPMAGGQGDPLLAFTNEGPVAKPMPFADRLDLIEAVHVGTR